MAKLLKLRRGTTSQHGSFTGAEGEVTIDTTKDTLVVHDNALAGGRPLLREDMSNLPAGTIDNADISGSAAIAGTKISPNFGGQNVSTTGAVDAAGMTISAAAPTLNFNDSNDNPDFRFLVNGQSFILEDTTAPANRFVVNNDGHIDITGNLDVGAGIDVTGSMSITGTVDGRDVAADGTKLDGIESSATADQTAAEIRTLVESASDSNVFTDADHSKLNGIEASATADQSNAEIRAAVEAASDSNVFTDADHSKLNGIAASATNVTNNNQISNGAGYITSSGSCSNADTVDSLHASSFLRSDAADTASGDITFSGGGGAITMSVGSDVRFSNGTGWTGEVDHKIQAHANSLYLQYRNDGNFIVRDSGGANNLVIDGSGNGTFLGNVTAYSDARLKTNVNTINDALSIVGKLRGVNFDWKESGKHSIGVIAQEVEEVLPELVLTNHNTNPSTGEVTDIKSVDYGKIVGVLINAINELKAEVDELKGGK